VLGALRVVGVVGALGVACQPFGETSSGASSEGGAPSSGATIQCGTRRCPVGADSVCCVTASGESCTTASACADAPLACDDTGDCAQLGFAADHICCAYNDGKGPTLLRSVCVLSSACDAAGPQDQLCDAAGPATQCQAAGDSRLRCAPLTYSSGARTVCR
jgi:hypothetical protein